MKAPQPQTLASKVFQEFGFVVVALFCALGLGICAAFLGIMAGPCLQVLFQSNTETIYNTEELFGGMISGIFIFFLGPSAKTISTSALFLILPKALLLISGLKFLFSFWQNFLWEYIAEKIAKNYRSRLVKSFLQLDPNERQKSFLQAQEARISAAISNDCRTMKEYIARFYGGFPRELVQVVILSVTLLMLSPKLVTIFFLGLLPIIIMLAVVGKKIKKRTKTALESYEILVEWIQIRLLGLETIKQLHTENIEISKFQSLTQKFFKNYYKAEKIKARTAPITEIVAVLSFIVIIAMAFYAIERNTLTASIALSFFASLVQLTQASNKMGKYWNSNREGLAAFERTEELFAALDNFAHKSQCEKSPEDFEALMELKGLSFTYDGTNFLFKNHSQVFRKNTFYLLRGPSGVGKSTFLKLLLGLLKPNQGDLLKKADLSIGYIPQQLYVLPTTIANNISYPSLSYDKLKMEKALTEVGFLEYVSNLPMGLETVLSASDTGLSGGQKQRLFLARLFYHDFSIVFIDEATSAIDQETENLIYQALLKLKEKQTTVIMISHREKASDFFEVMVNFPLT